MILWSTVLLRYGRILSCREAVFSEFSHVLVIWSDEPVFANGNSQSRVTFVLKVYPSLAADWADMAKVHWFLSQ